jgi:uncharacterized repeat protein (TIGR02543 family)
MSRAKKKKYAFKDEVFLNRRTSCRTAEVPMKYLTIVTIVFALFGFMLSCSSEPKIHQVTFDSNGGSAVQSVNVTDGARIEKPNDPAKPGFSFKGWYRQNDYQHEWNFSTDPVTADLTLYAKWEALTYTVTFDSQGGTPTTPPPKEVTFDEPYGTLPEVTRAGYQFIGWTTEPNGQGSIIETSTICMREEDHTLYAKWEAESYTVTFDPQGGTTPNPSSKKVYLNQAYGQLAETTKIGYRLVGWTTEPNGQGSIIEASTICTQEGNHTLYAKWEAARYTVTLNPQGGTTPNPATIYVYYGKPYGAFSKTTREGYRFFRWKDEDGNVVDAQTICARTEDHTLYAEWGTPFPFEGEAGGKVFYENPYYERDGWRYLEAAPKGWSGEDTDPKVRFGYYRPVSDQKEVATGADGRGIGDGLLNTQILVDKMKGTAYTTGAPHLQITTTTDQYAARICSELTLTHEGKSFDDWFLPSEEELLKLYGIPDTGCESASYWSSSERTASSAYEVSFNVGASASTPKSSMCHVRPIRKILTNTNP